MNSVDESTLGPSTAGRAAWICLLIAWACFVIPIPGTGLMIGWPLNLVAFILAIVAMSTRGASAGLWPLLASLILSPIIYFIGIAILAGMIQAASIPSATAEVTNLPVAAYSGVMTNA